MVKLSIKPKAKPKAKANLKWKLRLYIAGQTPNCIAAFANIKKICEEYLKHEYTLEVVDLLKKPSLARDHQILAIPTLVKKIPQPLRKIIGDLSNKENVIVGLDLHPVASKKRTRKSR